MLRTGREENALIPSLGIQKIAVLLNLGDNRPILLASDVKALARSKIAAKPMRGVVKRRHRAVIPPI